MILTASRNKDFAEPFRFRDGAGRTLLTPAGDYRVILSHGNYIREFSGLPITRNGVMWNIPADEVNALPYSTLYFVLTYYATELTRGVLRVE